MKPAPCVIVVVLTTLLLLRSTAHASPLAKYKPKTAEAQKHLKLGNKLCFRFMLLMLSVG